MQLAINYLFQSFPDQQVAVTPRPDGTLLLSLRRGDQQITKVIASEAVFSEAKIKDVVRDIHRDIKLAAGELCWKGAGAQWVWQRLPTYEGPIHVTKAKRLSQRPLVHMRAQLNAAISA
ncbi:hypothetical protein ACVW0Y_002317 [Pseudomonas sp. TE3786]